MSQKEQELLSEIERLKERIAELEAENKAMGDQHLLMLRALRSVPDHPRMPDGSLYDGPCECQECCSNGD